MHASESEREGITPAGRGPQQKAHAHAGRGGGASICTARANGLTNAKDRHWLTSAKVPRTLEASAISASSKSGNAAAHTAALPALCIKGRVHLGCRGDSKIGTIAGFAKGRKIHRPTELGFA